MIFGSGSIASALTVREGVTFFACGVSNSLCTDPKEYERERDTLKKAYNFNRNNRLVYFSTLSIYDKDTPYTRHKIQQEEWIRYKCNKYCIVRIGNITWGNNPHTIINSFKTRLAKNQHIDIEDRFKYLCNKDEFQYWMSMIPDFNTEMNITGERVTIQEIYNRVKDGRL